MKRNVAALCMFILLTLTVSANGQVSMLRDATDSKYKVGQVWSYKTRPQEEKSTFIVLKVESNPKLGNIVHIALRGLRLRKPNGGLIEFAGHLPFAEAALNQSSLKVLNEETDLPDYEEGYEMWRDAFLAGKAGVYTISVADAVGVMEKSLNQ